MRAYPLLLILLCACELEPAPKKAPPPPASAATAGSGSAKAAPPTPTPTPPPTPPPGPPADASIDAPMEVSQACVDMAAHLADVLISEQKDATQKAAIEQEKTRMIRRTAEACTRDSWKPEVLACFMKATASDQMEVCAKGLTLKD